MTRLIFGIGTIYYGRKNLQIRPGRCSHCGRTALLSSYDTRKWFVLFLIPIISQERLRIIDCCRVCKKHLVVESEQWEAAKQAEISKVLEEYQAKPTAGAAISVHERLVSFHQAEAATVFRKQIREKFSDDAKLHAALGAALKHLGLTSEADECFQRAWELQPDLLEARVGAASGLIRGGQLTQARALLDFLEKPGAAATHSIEPLYELGLAYQAAKRHSDALAIFAVMQREQPGLADQWRFRDQVQQSEHALADEVARSGEHPFITKRLGKLSAPRVKAVVAIVFTIGLILLALAGSNELIRRCRDLYIVNGFRQAATIHIQGHHEPLVVQGLEKLVLPEGTYRVKVSGPVEEEIEFTMRDDYLRRWFGEPLWVLNLGGNAILQLTHATYKTENLVPPVQTFYYDEKFRFFPDVTHPFRELPAAIKLSAGQSKTLIQLTPISAPPSALFSNYLALNDLPEAMRFAEWQLRKTPGDEELLTAYWQTAQVADPLRLKNFLGTGLTNRAVPQKWQRLYQGLKRTPN